MIPSINRCLAIFLLIQTSSAEVFTPEQLEKVDNFIQNVITCSNVPGLSLTIVKGDQVFTRGYGHTDIENNINTTPDSLFCIGSLTKAMTTTLLSKLLPEKFPNSPWDTQLKDILRSGFEFYTEELTERATLKDILTHRTGLVSGDFGVFGGYPPKTSTASFTKRLQYLPTSQPLRYNYNYNNWMYFLAGQIATALAGKGQNWEELLRQHLLEPLGMRSTVILTDLTEMEKNKLMALPYLYTGDNHQKMDYELYNIFPFESAGAVCSSASDMSKWLKFLLQSNSAPDLEDIVDANAFRETMKAFQLYPNPTARGLWEPFFPVQYSTIGYGLGWFLSSYRGRRQIEHSGGLFAYSSELWLFPDNQLGAYVSINGMGGSNSYSKLTILSYISDILLGLQPWLDSTTACTFPAPWIGRETTTEPLGWQQWLDSTTGFAFPANWTGQEAIPVARNINKEVSPQRPLWYYTGTYGHKLIGNVKVFVNRTTNTLQFNLGSKVQALLFPTPEKDVFQWELVGLFSFLNSGAPTVKFSASKGKRINSLVSEAIGNEIVFYKGTRF